MLYEYNRIRKKEILKKNITNVYNPYLLTAITSRNLQKIDETIPYASQVGRLSEIVINNV